MLDRDGPELKPRSKHSWILGELEFCTQNQFLCLEPISAFRSGESSAAIPKLGKESKTPSTDLPHLQMSGSLRMNCLLYLGCYWRLSGTATCKSPIGRCLERQVRLTKLHTLLPAVLYITMINHNLCLFAISIHPEVKHEVTVAAPFLSPPDGLFVINCIHFILSEFKPSLLGFREDKDFSHLFEEPSRELKAPVGIKAGK